MSKVQSLLQRWSHKSFGREVQCRYFGITDQQFTGGVFAPEVPAHEFHVGLVDETGDVVCSVLANQETGRDEIPPGHGFLLPVPAHWLSVGMHLKTFQFKVMETGKLFPKVPRELPVRLMRSLQSDSHHQLTWRKMVAAVESLPPAAQGHELLVVGTHEMSRTGAPLIILEIVKQLRARYRKEVVLLSLAPRGDLYEEFAQHCTLVIDDLAPFLTGTNYDGLELIAQLRERSGGIALINSLCAAKLAAACQEAGFEVKSLIHEYPHCFHLATLKEHLRASSQVIFPCTDVRDSYLKHEADIFGELGPDAPSLSVLPQGCYMLEKMPLAPKAAESFAEAFRKANNINPGDSIVVSCGSVDSRKGFDWLVALTRWYAEHSKSHSNTHFVWIGRVSDTDLFFHCLHDLRQSGRIGMFHHIDAMADIREALAMADVFLLCSRLDPFPSVVLESFLLGKPVIGFDRCQGSRDLILETGFGKVVPYQDLEATADAIDAILSDASMILRVREQGPELVRRRFQYSSYVDGIANALSGRPAVEASSVPEGNPDDQLASFPPVLLLGFHRSGTSYLTQFLLSIGVDMMPSGQSLGSGPGNPEGHFEDLTILNYHCSLLWRKHAAFMDRWGGKFCIFLPEYGDSWEEEIRAAQIVGRALGRKQPWGWKDPRTLLFFDLWKAVYPDAVRLIVLRHPLAICLSLLRRGTDFYFLADPLSLFDAYAGYHRAALADYRERPEEWFTLTMPATGPDLARLRTFAGERLGAPLRPMDEASLPDASLFHDVAIPPEIHEEFCRMFPSAGEVFDNFSGTGRHLVESTAPPAAERLDWLEKTLNALTDGDVVFCRDLALRFRSLNGGKQNS